MCKSLRLGNRTWAWTMHVSLLDLGLTVDRWCTREISERQERFHINIKDLRHEFTDLSLSTRARKCFKLFTLPVRLTNDFTPVAWNKFQRKIQYIHPVFFVESEFSHQETDAKMIRFEKALS